MVLLWAVVIGLIVGLCRGGNLKVLGNIRFRYSWLILIALIVQVLIFPLFGPEPIIAAGTGYLHYLSYGLLLLFVLFNVRIKPVVVMGMGLVLNFVVIGLNGGRMPASVNSLRKSGEVGLANELVSRGNFGNVIPMDSSTKLNVLGDKIFLPSWVPFSSAFSVGDVVISVGVIWLLGTKMVGGPPKNDEESHDV